MIKELPPANTASGNADRASGYAIGRAEFSKADSLRAGRSYRGDFGPVELRKMVRLASGRRAAAASLGIHVACVVERCAKKQVIGVATQSIVTVVANQEPRRDLAPCLHHVGDPVREQQFAHAADHEHSVPTVVNTRRPWPALAGVAASHLAPKSQHIAIVHFG